MTLRSALRCAALALALAALAGAALAQQRLLLGRWQARIGDSAAALTVITADGEGWIHGTLYNEPPLDGFAGAPFTTRIDNGAFGIRLTNGAHYDDLHWCRAALCGTYRAPDDTATPVVFARPGSG